MAEKPRALVYCANKYELVNKKVLDVGCSSGEYLEAFGKGSVGLDAVKENQREVNRRGFHFVHANLEEPLPASLGRFDVVFASNILEHMVSPYVFLQRVKKHLTDDGLLIVTCPVMTDKLAHRFRLFRGFDAVDHVNFYTKQTLEHGIKKAGYDLVETTAGVLNNRVLNFLFGKLVSQVSPQITVIARARKEFKISEKNLAVVMPSWAKDVLAK